MAVEGSCAPEFRRKCIHQFRIPALLSSHCLVLTLQIMTSVTLVWQAISVFVMPVPVGRGVISVALIRPSVCLSVRRVHSE